MFYEYQISIFDIHSKDSCCFIWQNNIVGNNLHVSYIKGKQQDNSLGGVRPLCFVQVSVAAQNSSPGHFTTTDLASQKLYSSVVFYYWKKCVSV